MADSSDILGLDIGGANIKAATSAGRAVSRPFAIWKHPDQLAIQIQSILGEFPGTSRLAVTMTAELADCFTTKSQGVRFILDQVDQCHLQSQVWATSGEFVSSDEGRRQPLLVAAANWHALATWVGRFLIPESNRQSALLIDIGSTTTDIIPLVNGIPKSVGRTDVSRMQSGELCYSAVKRTPLCAIAHSVPFRDGYCSLAAELFATTLDAYLLLGEIPEDESDRETANGQPATKQAAHDRIARMLCGDREEITMDESIQVARFLADVQRQRLAGALQRVVERLPTPVETVVVSGSGSFLARRLIAENRKLAAAKVISLDEYLSGEIAESACAYAAACLM